jgi:hypothetical protein
MGSGPGYATPQYVQYADAAPPSPPSPYGQYVQYSNATPPSPPSPYGQYVQYMNAKPASPAENYSYYQTGGYATGNSPATNRSRAPSAAPPPYTPPAPVWHHAAPGRDNVAVSAGQGRERSMRPLQASVHDKESTQDGGTVSYFTMMERRRYQVEMGGRLQWRASGLLVDTETLFKTIRALASANPDASTRSTVGSAMWGNRKSGTGRLTPPPGYSGKALIWVCAPDENGDAAFYSNACLIHKIHHSSFSVDKKVIGGGEWVIEAGRLLMVSPNSGHFRPDMSTFYNSVLHMSRAFNGDTKIVLYDRITDAYVARPVRDFISKPSDGGRYKVHVDAPDA